MKVVDVDYNIYYEVEDVSAQENGEPIWPLSNKDFIDDPLAYKPAPVINNPTNIIKQFNEANRYCLNVLFLKPANQLRWSPSPVDQNS